MLRKLRVVTNDRHAAEQVKSDSTLPVQGNLLRSKVENVVMGGSKVEKFWKIERQRNLKSAAMDGPKFGEFGKVGSEHKLKSIVMDGVKSGKEDKNVVIDGVKTGKVGKLENSKIEEHRDGWSQKWKSWNIGKLQN